MQWAGRQHDSNSDSTDTENSIKKIGMLLHAFSMVFVQDFISIVLVFVLFASKLLCPFFFVFI